MASLPEDTVARHPLLEHPLLARASTFGSSIHFLSLFQLLVRGPVKNEEALALYSRA